MSCFIWRSRRAFAAAGVLSLVSGASATLTLDPGTIIGGDSVAPGGPPSTIVKYDQSGTILDTLTLSDGIGIGTLDGLTVLGNSLFVCGTNNLIGQVDLNTGAIFGGINGVSVSGAEALGNTGSELLLGGYSSNTVDRFDAFGAFIGTINLGSNVGMTGLDSDGNSLFVGSLNDGNIYIYDMSGNQTGVVNTSVGGGAISGLGYDSGNNTVWLSLGFGNDDIVHYDLAGNNLGTFASQYPFIDGLDVIPLPTPGAGALLVLSALTASRRRR